MQVTVDAAWKHPAPLGIDFPVPRRNGFSKRMDAAVDDADIGDERISLDIAEGEVVALTGRAARARARCCAA